MPGAAPPVASRAWMRRRPWWRRGWGGARRGPAGTRARTAPTRQVGRASDHGPSVTTSPGPLSLGVLGLLGSGRGLPGVRAARRGWCFARRLTPPPPRPLSNGCSSSAGHRPAFRPGLPCALCRRQSLSVPEPPTPARWNRANGLSGVCVSSPRLAGGMCGRGASHCSPFIPGWGGGGGRGGDPEAESAWTPPLRSGLRRVVGKNPVSNVAYEPT